MSIKPEDAARRKTMKATIESVLCDPLTVSFGQGLKAAQITLALESQMAQIIAVTRTAALEEAAASDMRTIPSGARYDVEMWLRARAAKVADS